MADKQRLKCFGDANMSDACSQCPDNKECVEETVKRWRRRVKKKQEKSEMASHWRKPDHIAFLLMLPFIFAMFISSLAYNVSKDYMQLIVSSSSLILLFLWIIALAYDLTEESKDVSKTV